MYKAVIVDDEPLARKLIADYLTAYENMEVVATCANGFEGFKAITQLKPDLVFLDIRMPKITGLEMLELLEDPPGIIFTTAFDEYALKAFEANAVDYLLKPFSKERFNQAVSKWITAQQNGIIPSAKQLTGLPLHHRHENNRMVVKSGHQLRILPFSEILFIEAFDDYIKVHIRNDCFLKKQTMQQTEMLLPESEFTRVHRSFIVNVSEITRIEPHGKDTYVAVMRDATSIPLSKTGYAKLKQVLGI
jgi:two-component system, LytTR family, response regulator